MKIRKAIKKLVGVIISATVISSLLIGNASAITTSYYSNTAYHPWYGENYHNFNGYGGSAIANNSNFVWGYPSKTSLLNGQKSLFCQSLGHVSKSTNPNKYSAWVSFASVKVQGQVKTSDYVSFMVNIFDKNEKKLIGKESKFTGSNAYIVDSDRAIYTGSSTPKYAQSGTVFSSSYEGTWYGGVYCVF